MKQNISHGGIKIPISALSKDQLFELHVPLLKSVATSLTYFGML